VQCRLALDVTSLLLGVVRVLDASTSMTTNGLRSASLDRRADPSGGVACKNACEM
jgi:hypothetical protein